MESKRIDKRNKHAYLIMATGHYEELCELLKALDYIDNDIYVHIDAKDSNIPKRKLETCCCQSNLFFIPRIKVTWGGSSQIDCILLLLKCAVKKEYSFMHLLSGVDYPVYSQEVIHAFFSEHEGENFIHKRLDAYNTPNFRMRYEQFHLLQDVLVGKKRNFFKYLDFLSCYIQKIIGVRRFHKQNMALSSTWFSISSELAKYLVSKSDQIHKKYLFTYCCDEVFLLSEILDTKFVDTLSSYDYLRFLEWHRFSKRDTSPRALTINDYEKIMSSNCFFIRKIHFPKSYSLIEKLKNVSFKMTSLDGLSF